MSTISPIHTPCKSCVFAKYENNTQTDCALDYIDLYKEKNIEILEAFDEEKEFYIINNKKCIGYREKGWFEKRKLDHLTIDEKVAKFKEKNYLHYLLHIDLKEFNVDDLEKLVTVLKNLSIKPRKIIFVRHQNDETKFSYELIQKIIVDSQIESKWRIQTMLVERDYRDILHETINLNKKYRFILSVKSNCEDLDKLINLGNTMVYKDMNRFVVIRNHDKSCMLFSTPNYRHSFIVEKKDILEEESYHIIV
jgi:hypothetical protein